MSINTNSTLFRQQAYINGQWVDAQDKSVFDVTNPADNTVIAKVSNVGAVETQRAIEAAEKALPAWRAKTAKERSQILNKWFRLMMDNQKELAQLLSAEQGKSMTESMGEIAYGASFIEWFAEEGKRVYGESIPSPLPGRRLNHQTTCGRCRSHHTMELPECDDHAQSGPSPCGRLYDGAETCG